MTKEEIAERLEHWHDDDHICASLSAFNLAGRVKKCYRWDKPHDLLTLEIWSDNGDVMCSLGINQIACVGKPGKHSREMLVEMKDGCRINLR